MPVDLLMGYPPEHPSGTANHSDYAGKLLKRMDQLDDVTYRIQKGAKAKPKVVHHNRLKPYEGTNAPTWLDDLLTEEPTGNSNSGEGGKMSQGKMAQGKMSQGKMSQGKMAQGKMAQGKMSQGKMARGKVYMYVAESKLTKSKCSGAHNRFKNEISTQTFGIDKMVIHRRFLANKGLGPDIALIKLSRPAVLTFAVGLACLPRQGDRVPVGTKCYLTVLYRKIIIEQISHHMTWTAAILNFDFRNKFQQTSFPGVFLWERVTSDRIYPWVPEDDEALALNLLVVSAITVFVALSKGIVAWWTMWLNTILGGAKSPSVGLSGLRIWYSRRMPDYLYDPTFAASGDECSDNHYYCSVWKETGKCKHWFYIRALKNYCPLSCGYCTLGVKAKCLDSFIDSILQLKAHHY
ncbi:hypothetical protein QZH41_018672 [Actinostola sp. cb2023]|nr:hypothetical protein QZH41_018672 [Actinostola sp. cb2023]